MKLFQRTSQFFCFLELIDSYLLSVGYFREMGRENDYLSLWKMYLCSLMKSVIHFSPEINYDEAFRNYFLSHVNALDCVLVKK